jgi:hypothetical protein
MRFSTSLFGKLACGPSKSVLNQLSTSWLMGFLLSSVTAFAIRRKAASILELGLGKGSWYEYVIT